MRQRAILVLIVAIPALCVALLAGVAYRTLYPPALDSVDIELPGLVADVVVRRDGLGVPRLEAASWADLGLAAGWVMAEDRMAQMETLRLVAQGRLSEMAGPPALGLDVLMRSLDLTGVARASLQRLSPEGLVYLQQFSAGVNRFVEAGHWRHSTALSLADWQPAPWQPLDSLAVMALLAHALSYNLTEELAFLDVASVVGVQRAPWLFPVYPDEPLDFREALRLQSLSLRKPPLGLSDGLPSAAAPAGREAYGGGSLAMDDAPATVLPGLLGPVAASNNWVLRPELTRHGAVILANDTHLLLTQPALWMMIEMALPERTVAGVALAGVPLVMAGTNRDVAWGMTMVMADTQDLFLERLLFEDGQWLYETPQGWEPTATREEQFRIRGAKAVNLVLQATRHGPLLNDALTHPSRDLLQPYPVQSEYGLALATTLNGGDASFDALWSLNRAANLDAAIDAGMGLELAALNLLIADPQHIAWLITGRFPVRHGASGHFPVPGWSGDYDWQGFVEPQQRPLLIDPDNAFFATANQRTFERAEVPFTLSSSWYAPERHERIVQMIQQIDEHDLMTSLAMQHDRLDLFFIKVRERWRRPEVAESLRLTLAEVGDADRDLAERAMAMLLDWDGVVDADSPQAALWGMFEHQLTRRLFLDELGPEHATPWKAFVRASSLSYPALQDHLLGRIGSPFWDDAATPEVETRYHIVNQALAASYRALLERSPDPSRWRWGDLHTYTWRSGVTALSAEGPWWQRAFTPLLRRLFDRGPHAAGGNRNTVNVAGFSSGESFDAWNIPAMRMIVDFSQEEPLHLVIAGGQSDDPYSPHYADGIPFWLQPETRRLPLQGTAVAQQFSRVRTLRPPPSMANAEPAGKPEGQGAGAPP